MDHAQRRRTGRRAEEGETKHLGKHRADGLRGYDIRSFDRVAQVQRLARNEVELDEADGTS